MIYSGTVSAKTGDKVPLFADGKPMHSKYNPASEAALLSGTKDCIVVCGMGGGFHLLEALKTCSLVIVCEKTDEEVLFCKSLDSVKKILLNKNVIFTSTQKLALSIMANYLPHIHGNISLVSQRAWEEHEKKEYLIIKQIFSSCVKSISADYSVQAHFAKLWQRNIFLNLKNFTQNPDITDLFDTKKTAAIIAAGPSLDRSINVLKETPQKYSIFATDTSLQVLLKNDIIPDAVVSIDAQHVSTAHFKSLYMLKESKKKPVCFFDASSCSENIFRAKKYGCPVFLVHNGHPLLNLASQSANIPQVQAGSGTVTIAAADIARRLHFEGIEFFGADFAYSAGKPYTRGTYLDALYAESSERTGTMEQSFCALMFRTPLTPAKERHDLNNAVTNDTLEGYRLSLMQWKTESTEAKDLYIKMPPFDFKTFCSDWKKNTLQSIQQNDLTPYSATLLPLTAYFKKRQNDNLDFFSLAKLAYSYSLRYTE